jgi:hypothetical protein
VSRLRAQLRSRRGLAVVLAAAVLVAAGVAFAASSGEDVDPADARFARLCRERGGEPSLAPGSGDYVKDARKCEVRYGGHTYEMYALTAEGFDEREAADQRRSCALLARQEKDIPGAPRRRVFHPDTAICEAVD